VATLPHLPSQAIITGRIDEMIVGPSEKEREMKRERERERETIIIRH
jgi:hypothetical protein